MEKLISWVEIEVGIMAIKQGQVGYSVSLNQKYVAAWQALLWDLKNATKSVTEILAEEQITDTFTVLVAANATYEGLLDASTDLTTTYFNAISSGKLEDEAAARADIATDAPTQLTGLSTYLAAWKTVINNAANNSNDKEVFYNMVAEDRNLFVAAFQTIVDAVDDAYSLFKGLTDTMNKYIGTSIETVSKTHIPAAAAALGAVSQKMNRAHAELQSSIVIAGATDTLPLPAQTNIAKAITSLTTITTASTGTIALFSAANSQVFTDLATDV